MVGTSAALANLKHDDFQVFANVANLSPGVHKVELTIEGPEGVSWKADNQSVSISISEKEGSST